MRWFNRCLTLLTFLIACLFTEIISANSLIAPDQSEQKISEQLSHQNKQHFSVGWELWYPFQFRDKSQQLVGLDFEIFQAILAQAGFTADYVELPWKRHLLLIKSGEIDIAMGASFSNERKQYAYFTEPYRTETVRLYVLKKHVVEFNLPSLSDLTKTNYLIGIEGGYYYGDTFQHLMKNSEFQTHINEVIDIEQNILMLMKERIDGVLVDPATMNAFVNKYGLQGEIVPIALDVYHTDIHLMLSKKTMTHQQLERFNQAIKQLKSQGKIQQIIDYWLNN
jgi:polar amino acid transport system substrate-binding protein